MNVKLILSLKYNVDITLQSESVFVSIVLPGKKILLCLTYIPPGSPSEEYSNFLGEAEHISGNNPDHEVILLSDFNLPYIE